VKTSSVWITRESFCFLFWRPAFRKWSAKQLKSIKQLEKARAKPILLAPERNTTVEIERLRRESTRR